MIEQLDMARNSFIIETLGRLYDHAEGLSDAKLMQQVGDAEATAIREIFQAEYVGKTDCYESVMKVVFPDMVEGAEHDRFE